MTLIVHKPTCIGGVKGPCNCGALEEGERLQYLARRRSMQNIMRSARESADSLERQAEKLLTLADQLQMDMNELDRLHNMQKPAAGDGPIYAPIDNPA